MCSVSRWPPLPPRTFPDSFLTWQVRPVKTSLPHRETTTMQDTALLWLPYRSVLKYHLLNKLQTGDNDECNHGTGKSLLNI